MGSTVSGKKRGAIFLTGNLLGHVVRMSLTASIGLSAMFAVDFVDMIFISMLGNNALAAAVGYAGTLLFFTNSINIGLSIAAGSLVARSIGADRPEDASRYATNVALFAAGIGIVLPLVLLPNLRPVFGLLGAEGEVLDLAIRYVRLILPTMSVLGVAFSASAVLRAHGDARRSMLVTLYGGVVNAILDPLFIFTLDLGLEGAALASVAARLTMLVAALWPAIRLYGAFARPRLPAFLGDLRAIRAIALPAVLANVATPVGNALVTRELAQFGTEAVAGMAVIGRLMPVAFAVIFALSGAIGPIIGQNFGAGQSERVRGAFVDGIRFTLVYVLLASAILFLLRAPIADAFRAAGETRTLIYLFCGPLALATFFNGVIFVANASFNNLDHAIYSTEINWGRHTLGTWPFAVLGGKLGGASGVLLGQALGGVFFAALAWWLAARVMSRLVGRTGKPDAFIQQSRLQALFGRCGW
jgi:putative MATE family efflux protein